MFSPIPNKQNPNHNQHNRKMKIISLLLPHIILNPKLLNHPNLKPRNLIRENNQSKRRHKKNHSPNHTRFHNQ